MFELEEKYLNLLSVNLRNFAKENDKRWSFSCPDVYCGDSKKSKWKKRGYLLEFENNLFYKCHNCGVARIFKDFLKEVNFTLYQDYVFEKIQNPDKIVQISEPIEIKPKRKYFSDTYENINLKSIKELDNSDIFKKYIMKRQIPEKYHDILFYVSDLKDWAKGRISDEKYETLHDNDSRILIPFYDTDKKLIGGQARTIFKSDLRYITFKTNKENKLIYGLERINPEEVIYVVEGPIDSLFLPNCVAAATSDLPGCIETMKNYLTFDEKNVVLIFDNEPDSNEITNIMAKSIKKGHKIFFWPKNIKVKDINDCIISGLTSEKLLDIIKENTFSGLMAELEFNRWRNCNK